MDKSIMFAWNITEGFLKQARDLLRPEGMFSLSLSISLLCKSRQSGFYQMQDRITIATIIRSLLEYHMEHSSVVTNRKISHTEMRNTRANKSLVVPRGSGVRIDWRRFGGFVFHQTSLCVMFHLQGICGAGEEEISYLYICCSMYSLNGRANYHTKSARF